MSHARLNQQQTSLAANVKVINELKYTRALRNYHNTNVNYSNRNVNTNNDGGGAAAEEEPGAAVKDSDSVRSDASFQARKHALVTQHKAEMLKRRQWLFSAFIIGASIILSSCIIAGAVGGAQSSIPWCPNITSTANNSTPQPLVGGTSTSEVKTNTRIKSVARSLEKCVISGKVVDEHQQAVEDVVITLKLPDEQVTMKTNADGEYIHEAAAACDPTATMKIISLRAKKDGFKEDTFFGPAKAGFDLMLRRID